MYVYNIIFSSITSDKASGVVANCCVNCCVFVAHAAGEEEESSSEGLSLKSRRG